MNQHSRKGDCRTRENPHGDLAHVRYLAQLHPPPFKLLVLHRTRQDRPAPHLDYQNSKYLPLRKHRLLSLGRRRRLSRVHVRMYLEGNILV